ncbi:MAG TPA: hypothetical protein P5277_03770 [Candidatus Paceibacterota bacterium]|nr:hypothetical protein [Candidatus Paceibacterota bacterium]
MINKKGIELQMLGWILLAVAVLVLSIFIIIYLSKSQIDALSFFQRIFDFRRN